MPISVDIFSTEAMMPLRSGVKIHQMSAKGVRIHLIVKGVYFHTDQRREELVPAGPLPVFGQFPSGELDETGRIPQKASIRARYFIPGAGQMKDTRLWKDAFYCQAAVSEHPEAAQGINVKKAKTVGMRAANREKRRQQAAGPSSEPLEEGEVSEPAGKAPRTTGADANAMGLD
jgi:hypothetical protein